MSHSLVYAVVITIISAGFAIGVLAYLVTSRMWIGVGVGSITVLVLSFKVFGEE